MNERESLAHVLVLQPVPQRNGLNGVLVILKEVIYALLANPPMNLGVTYWGGGQLAEACALLQMSGPNNTRV